MTEKSTFGDHVAHKCSASKFDRDGRRGKLALPCDCVCRLKNRLYLSTGRCAVKPFFEKLTHVVVHLPFVASRRCLLTPVPLLRRFYPEALPPADARVMRALVLWSSSFTTGADTSLLMQVLL
ncbi:hypothetical protein HPB50_015915 [Hyalomma asiaticum]|uniref:Uncharacterized protein n=1 Tax=Hyalomma asiaticum TaxID=266040 RepID=A0ACB7RVL0_HYAAI|nr:hypothetical protein HPB50_015915 [Hyalomma asiaticum]